MKPEGCIDAILRSLKDVDELSEFSFVNREPDTSGENSDIRLPAIVVQTISNIRIDNHNTDLVEYITDEDGEDAAARFVAEYDNEFQLDVWTAAQSGYSPDEIGETVRDRLYTHDKAILDEPFVDESGDPIDTIWNFRVGDGSREDDLTMSHSLRRWRQELFLTAADEFTVEYPIIEEVNQFQEVN